MESGNASRSMSRIAHFACLVLVAVSVIVRFPKADTQNYCNSDATYHVLLTVQAYKETPSWVHHFLPIVSLGKSSDKGISWGATIPDARGNYYYTSFSPAGFFIPYAFLTTCHLPVDETSLYLFNSILYTVSFCLAVMLFQELFGRILSPVLIEILTALVYLFQLEIMHSQGIAYWHHALFQLLFVAQSLLFFRFNSRSRKFLFFAICVVAPYVEWTGFFSNMAFCLAFALMKDGAFSRNEDHRASAIRKCSIVTALTVISFGLFCTHFLSVVSWDVFSKALMSRFAARNISVVSWDASSKALMCSLAAENISGGPSFFCLLKCYVTSYGLLLMAIGVGIGLVVLQKDLRTASWKIISARKKAVLVFSVPLLENLVLKEHAISYSFDRMKAVFFLLFLVLVIIAAFQEKYGGKFTSLSAIAVFAAIGIVNLTSYVSRDNLYRWNVAYLKNNRAVAERINQAYPEDNSILTQPSAPTRGYANMLFERGIYEFINLDRAIEIAGKEGKRFVVLLNLELKPWNMYDYSRYKVYDCIAHSFIGLGVGDSATGSTDLDKIAGSGNFTGAGRTADVLVRNTSTGVVGAWITGSGSWQRLGTLGSNWTIAGVGDFNGDGKADVLVQNTSTGVVRAWITGGSWLDLGRLDSGWTIAGVGNFTGTGGKADVLVQNTSTGVVRAWITGSGRWQHLGMLGPQWAIAGVGDFNGDGKADVLLKNTNTGLVGAWITGGSWLGLGKLCPGWTIAGAEDFNGHGKADVLLDNTNTGTVGAWISGAAWQYLGSL